MIALHEIFIWIWQHKMICHDFAYEQMPSPKSMNGGKIKKS
jgi:hypothetical protein